MYRKPSPHSVASARYATWFVLAALAASLVAGCRSEPAAGRATAGTSQAMDPCASNMHELSGYLLQYYVVNHTLPEQLSDLEPLVDVGQKLPLTCPASGKPYVYFRDGLVAVSEPKRLLVIDPEPAHNGKHWGLVTLPPEGKTPLGLWVTQLTPTAVQQFHRP